MANTRELLKTAKSRDLLASAVLAMEAFYFIIATAVITAFGVQYAQGKTQAFGLLGVTTLPLVAVGAFAIWSLALLHVLPSGHERGHMAQCRATSKVATVGFYVVVAAHVIYSVVLMSRNSYLLASAILTLGILLLICSLSQVRIHGKTPAATMALSKM